MIDESCDLQNSGEPIKLKWEFNEGFACYENNRKYGMIDKNFNKVVEPVLMDYSYLYNSRIATTENLKDYFYLDKTGNKIFNKYFEIAGNFTDSSRAIVKYNKRFTMINFDGEEIIAPFNNNMIFADYSNSYSSELDWITSEFHEKRAWFLSSNSIGYVNLDGKEVIKSLYKLPKRRKDGSERYEISHNFRGGLVRLLKNGKEGYIDINGEEYFDNSTQPLKVYIPEIKKEESTTMSHKPLNTILYGARAPARPGTV